MTKWITIPVLAAVLCGCATHGGFEAAKEARAAYEAFVSQQRSYRAIALRGDTMTITITGASELTMDAPLPPLSAIPRENDTPARIADAAKNAVLGLAGIWALRDIAMQPATVVTQPPPMVVRPEVVTVP
ncbi:hypothetical protein [Thermosphaera sp.]